MNRRYLAIFLALQIIPALLLFHSIRNPLHIKVEAVGDSFNGYIDGQLICSYKDPAFPRGLTGLYLRQEIYSQGWDHFIVSDYHTGEILYSDSFGHEHLFGWSQHPWPWFVNILGEFTTYVNLDANMGDFSIALTGDPMWQDYTIEADLDRGLDAAIMLRCTGPNTGLCFNFRPKHEDAFFLIWDHGMRGDCLSATVFPTPLKYNVNSIIEKLLKTYFVALAIMVGFLVVYSLLFWIYQPLKRFLSSLTAQVSNFFTNINPEVPFWGERFLIMSLFGLAFIITRHVAIYILQKIPHVQDSISTLFQAKVFAMGRLYADAPRFAEAFDFEMIVNTGGKWFTKYTIGHSLVMVPGVLIDKPWLMGPLLGALAVPVIYKICREISTFRVALMASILCMASPFFLFMSGSYMAHTSCLLFAALYHLFYIKSYKTYDQLYAIFAGLCLGMTMIIRPLTGLAVVIPGIFWGAPRVIRGGKRGVWLIIFLIMGTLPPLTFQLFFNNATTGDPFVFGYTAYSDIDRLGFGDVGWYGTHSPRLGFRNVELNLQELLYHLYGWYPYLTLAFMMLPFIFLSKKGWDYYFLLTILFQVGGYFFWWYHGICYGPRFWYECLPGFTYLTARGIDILAVAASTMWKGRQKHCIGVSPARRFAFVLGSTFLLVLIYNNITDYMPRKIATEYYSYNYTNDAIIRRVKQLGINNAVIFVNKDSFWSVFGSVFHLNSPRLDTDIVYARDAGTETNRLIMQQYPGKRAYYYDGFELYPMSIPGR